MSDNVRAFPGSPADQERRRFLAPVADALRTLAAADTTCLFSLVQPVPGVGPRLIGLVVSWPSLGAVAQVIPVTFTRHMVSTRPTGDVEGAWPGLDAMRALLRNVGVAAVTGATPSYDPFPGDGQPTYELTILRAPEPTSLPDATRHPDTSQWTIVEGHHAADPREIAQRIVAWHQAETRTYPPEPRTAASLAPLRALAAARRTLLTTVDRAQIDALRQAGRLEDAWRLAGVETSINLARIDQPSVELTAAARDRLRADLAALLPVALNWHFPRDERGRLALGECVLLTSYDSAVPLSQGRDLWLTVEGPARRRDPQHLTLQLSPLIGENHTHVWRDTPWLWDARAQAAPPTDRWGIDTLPLAHLGLDSWRAALSDDADASPAASDADLAARSIWLQDAGRLTDALALYRIETDAEVSQLLAGGRIPYSMPKDVEPWARTTQEGLRGAALWRFGPVVRHAAAERTRWVAEKRSRKWSPPTLRLFWLPHQTQQAKAAVVLRPADRDGSHPRLEVDASASNTRLPAVAWQRPSEIDLLRFGLLTADDQP